MSKKRSGPFVSKYLEELALEGRYYFSIEELCQNLSLKRSSLSVSLSRLAKQGKVKMIRKGFGIITSQTRGSLHPSYFVDAMMKHLEANYYVGLLSAAAHWGASHQASMKFFVVADKVIKPIKLERMEIVFIKKNIVKEREGIQKVQGVGGYFLVSSSELTALDLVKFSKKSGYLNNVATVLEDLLDEIKLKKLESVCDQEDVSTTTLQRLGFILEKVLGRKKEAKTLQRVLKKRRPSRIVLSVAKKKKQKFSEFPFDKKWMIYENMSVEPD